MKLILFIALLILSNVSLAGSWSGWGKVTELQTYAANTFRFKTSAPHIDANNGTPCGSGWYRVSDFTGFQKEQVSMLLAAYAAGKDIRVNVSGCGGYNNADTEANYFHLRE
ncbi:hypothetical protein FKG94_28060 [Exilibacterium tricleocarpae]|uniref:Uncharacterized protein n=1 Tax=Exilibacterium tricleocarpae TaxID=2591008 RepID=A0A545SLG7_9GAMM|nr:hypothetical protein [Exilibacterium tricleocarpae]TQV65824.1 hypothetical protein FKG94_28060 [Exilibacterium tricleocarpae]